MTEGIEEIGGIVPVTPSEQKRTDAPRRDTPTEPKDAPTPPSAHPFKGRVLDIIA